MRGTVWPRPHICRLFGAAGKATLGTPGSSFFHARLFSGIFSCSARNAGALASWRRRPDLLAWHRYHARRMQVSPNTMAPELPVCAQGMRQENWSRSPWPMSERPPQAGAVSCWPIKSVVQIPRQGPGNSVPCRHADSAFAHTLWGLPYFLRGAHPISSPALDTSPAP